MMLKALGRPLGSGAPAPTTRWLILAPRSLLGPKPPLKLFNCFLRVYAFFGLLHCSLFGLLLYIVFLFFGLYIVLF